MGAWDKLDTEISVKVDTSNLERILSMNDETGVFDPVIETVERLIKGMHDGSKEAVQDISKRNKSFQQQAISSVCDNPTGMLKTSIQAKEINGGYGFIVGTIINHIYPLCVEFGRGEVHPIPPKTRLRYYGKDGYLIYPKKAGKAEPRPFVAPAYEKTNRIAEQIMLMKVENAKKRM